MIATHQKNPSNHSTKSLSAHLNKSDGNGNASSSSLNKQLQQQASFKSPFMYGARDDESVMGLNMAMCGADSDYSTDCSTDYSCGSTDEDDTSSASSFAMDCSEGLIDHDDDLDELEKALEIFAYREERLAAKEEKKQRSMRKTKSLDYEAGTTTGTRRSSMHTDGNGGDKKQSSALRKQRTLDPNFAPLSPKRTTTTVSPPVSAAAAPAPAKSSNGPAFARQNTNSSQESHKSNKSLPLSALMVPQQPTTPEESNHSKGRTPRRNRRSSTTTTTASSSATTATTAALSNSNRSLSLPTPKDKLNEIFFSPAAGTGSAASKALTSSSDFDHFQWDRYFEECKPDSIGTMHPELERTIKAKNLKRLKRLVEEKGLSLSSRNKHGETVAHLICREGCAEMLLYVTQERGVSVRVRDLNGKTPLQEVACNPTLNPSVAMMLLSDSPELLWAPDTRGFSPLQYVPKHAILDWYDFLDAKKSVLKLALQFSRFKATSKELNANQERLQKILQRQLSK